MTKFWDHLKLGSPRFSQFSRLRRSNLHHPELPGYRHHDSPDRYFPILLRVFRSIVAAPAAPSSPFVDLCLRFFVAVLSRFLTILSIGCSKLQVFVLIAATNFSGLICFVSASANMQSVSTHLQTSVASLLLGRVSVTIGAPIASPLRLQIACRRDAIVMPRRLSDGFPIVGRTSALRLLSQSVTHTSWIALVASISHCFLDKGTNMSTIVARN